MKKNKPGRLPPEVIVALAAGARARQAGASTRQRGDTEPQESGRPTPELPSVGPPTEPASTDESTLDEPSGAELPADETATEQPVPDEAPVDEAPVDEAPVDETPVDETPTDQAAALETPGDEPPTHQPVPDQPAPDQASEEPAGVPADVDDAARPERHDDAHAEAGQDLAVAADTPVEPEGPGSTQVGAGDLQVPEQDDDGSRAVAEQATGDQRHGEDVPIAGGVLAGESARADGESQDGLEQGDESQDGLEQGDESQDGLDEGKEDRGLLSRLFGDGNEGEDVDEDLSEDGHVRDDGAEVADAGQRRDADPDTRPSGRYGLLARLLGTREDASEHQDELQGPGAGLGREAGQDRPGPTPDRPAPDEDDPSVGRSEGQAEQVAARAEDHPEVVPTSAGGATSAEPKTASGRRRRLSARDVALVACLLIVLVLTAVLVRAALKERSATTAQRPVAKSIPNPPPAAPKQGSYVESRVAANGTVRVRQWVRSRNPLFAVRLEMPAAPGGDRVPRATNVVVTSDQALLNQPAFVGSTGQRLFFNAPPKVVYLSYILKGAVDMSPSVPGRALARATSMHIEYSPLAGPTRVTLVSAKVLSMACSDSPVSDPRPCGHPGDGRWSVLLKGKNRTDTVVAQVDLKK
jgi:hypothetical protein